MTGIIFSQNNQTIDLCFDVCSELGIGLLKIKDFATLLIEIQNDNANILIIDCESSNESLKWIKIIKKINYHLPVIVICDNPENIDGGRFYEAGVFNISQRPLSEELFKDIIEASIKNTFNKNN